MFATAAEWVDRLALAHSNGRLHDELRRLGHDPLIVIDEVGYIPFEPEAANLFFQLISARYERASVIVTSNKPFGRWGETFGDDTVAAAMIDRLVHHAEVQPRLPEQGAESSPSKATATGSKTATSGGHPPTTPTDHNRTRQAVNFHPPPGGQLSAAVEGVSPLTRSSMGVDGVRGHEIESGCEGRAHVCGVVGDRRHAGRAAATESLVAERARHWEVAPVIETRALAGEQKAATRASPRR